MFLLRPVLFLALALLLSGAPAFGLDIELLPEATVSGELITLGEIARLSPAGPKAEGYGAISLFRSPLPGGESVIGRDAVERYLAQHGTDLATVSWSGAQSVRVLRPGVGIDQGRIREVLEEYLANNRSALPPADVRFKSISETKPFVLPAGSLEIEIIPDRPSLLDARRFTILYRVDGRLERNLSVRAELEAIAPVVVAARDLRRGQILTAADLLYADGDLAQLRDPVLDQRELVGTEMKRSLRQGSPVERSAVEIPPLVRRGELVTITASKGALTVTARGLAKQDGKMGEMIRVVNNSSDKEIFCKVLGPGLVGVEL